MISRRALCAAVLVFACISPASAQVTTVPVVTQVPFTPAKVDPPKVKVQPDATLIIINSQSLNVSPKVVGLSPTTVAVRTAKAKPGVSGPLCGGVINGVPQPACLAKYAKFESKALGTCPAGTFLDIGLWQCWKCPA